MAKTTPTGSAPDGETLEETQARLAGKGRPTPTRRERELQRKRPLVPDDRRQAARDAREKMRSARERARIGMANGEERYLPARDKGPQKAFVRDWVDSRFSLGEFMIPVMFAVIVLTFIPSPDVQFFVIMGLWLFFIAVVVDAVILGRTVRKRLGTKFGESRVENGVRWYAAMRALQLRALRLPKPRVKRGERPA